MTDFFISDGPAVSSFRRNGRAVSEDEDKRWKELTAQANEAYAREDVSLARMLYDEALTEAERLFAAAIERPGFFPAPVIYNVSCHNLAELEESRGNYCAAELFYRRACDRLHDAARSPVTVLTMRLACIQHLNRALLALARYFQMHGGSKGGSDDIFLRADETVCRVLRVARCAGHNVGIGPRLRPMTSL